MIKKLMYKDFMLIMKSPVLLYSVLFLFFSLVISFKVDTMRYTGILFLIYIIFVSVSKYEEKYSGHLTMRTLPVSKKEIAEAKYRFLSFILFGTTAIMYFYNIISSFSANLAFEIVIVLFTGTIYITKIYKSYYNEKFKQVQTKVMLIAICMNIICSVLITLLNMIKVNMILVVVSSVLLLFTWHVGKELNYRYIEKVKI